MRRLKSEGSYYSDLAANELSNSASFRDAFFIEEIKPSNDVSPIRIVSIWPCLDLFTRHAPLYCRIARCERTERESCIEWAIRHPKIT